MYVILKQKIYFHLDSASGAHLAYFGIYVEYSKVIIGTGVGFQLMSVTLGLTPLVSVTLGLTPFIFFELHSHPPMRYCQHFLTSYWPKNVE